MGASRMLSERLKRSFGELGPKREGTCNTWIERGVLLLTSIIVVQKINWSLRSASQNIIRG